MDRQDLLDSCAHQRVMYRPVGGHSIERTPRWICDVCGRDFVPRENLDALAFRLESLMIATAHGLETHLDHERDESRALLARLGRPVAIGTPLRLP